MGTPGHCRTGELQCGSVSLILFEEHDRCIWLLAVGLQGDCGRLCVMAKGVCADVDSVPQSWDGQEMYA